VRLIKGHFLTTSNRVVFSMDIHLTAGERSRCGVLLTQIGWQILLTLVLWGTFLASSWAEEAGAGNPLPMRKVDDTLMIQQPHCEDGSRTYQDCTVEERLLVPVAHLNQELEALGLRAEDLTLLLDGVPMASKATEVCEKDACELSFRLHRVIASVSNPERDSPNAAAWSELFSHWDDDAKSVSVALRHDARVWPSGNSVSLHTRRVYGMPLILMVGTAICMVVLFTLMPGVVRERQYFPDTWKGVGDAAVARRFLAAVVGVPVAAESLKPVEAARRLLLPPVSLSQTLTVWWLVIVMLSFGYMLYVTHSVDIVNATMLALLGIPVTVTAGACVVDRANSQDAGWDADLLAALTGDQALAAEQTRALLTRARETMLITRNLATDLLSETTPETWDPHRVQILVFSVVFGVYYMSQLNRLVALPDFSSAVLTLLGISSATYLGFKVVKAQG
jgi:hypothetical protein